MEEFFKNLFDKGRGLRLLICAASVAIIGFFLPRSDKQSLYYAVNKPWSYALLTAPFDIPIELDSARIKSIKDSINENFECVYKFSLDIQKKNIPALEKELQNHTEINYKTRTALLAKAINLYEDGIVDNDTHSKIESGEIHSLKLRSGKTITTVDARKLLSERDVYEQFDSLMKASGYAKDMLSLRLNRFIDANVEIDSVSSLQRLEQAYLNNLSPRGMVQVGEKIVDRGDIVTPKIFSILNTYERMLSEREHADMKKKENFSILGSLGIIVMLLVGLMLFLSYFRFRLYSHMRNVCFIFTVITVASSVMFLCSEYWPNSVYVMPFALVPLILTTFLDSRVAFFTHVVIIMISALAVQDPQEFILLQFVGGVVGIVSIQEMTSRSQLVKSAFFIFVAYVFTYTFYNVMRLGAYDFMSMTRVYGYLDINTVLLSFSYILIFLIEKVFGYVSTLTLVEISDINTPVLRELSDKCPGSFQHSLQVANLAAEAAHSIGADVQLVRAGAMYHDIGKIENPAFFTENQRDVNPHNAMSPDVSARVIIEHVENGVERAEAAKLPPVIKDFIREHHGRSKVKYFYTTACNNAPEGVTIDHEIYSYKGPNPRSKETAILMMADATEAACKSLKEHTEESIRNLVEKIINSQIADGLFNDAPISFRDVEIIKEVFTQRLCSFYHTRIAYPEAKKAAPASSEEG